MEIRKSTEKGKETIHKMLQEFNSRFMYDFDDYSYHIEESGSIVAEIVSESKRIIHSITILNCSDNFHFIERQQNQGNSN